jgi:hypothetical protein
MPCIDAVEVVESGIELIPTTFAKYVGALAVCVTRTAFGGGFVLGQVVPFGIRLFRQIRVTVGGFVSVRSE